MAQLLVAAAVSAGASAAATAVGVAATQTFIGMTVAQWGFMAGSMLGSMLFQDNPSGPKIEQGKFTSTIYGQPIPLNYGTQRHAAQVAWWSGLKVRKESGGKKAGSYEVASMDLFLSVCEGPQAAVLRIWANGRLIYDATQGATPFIDAEVLPAGDIRIYLGTEGQTTDPTYEAAVGTGMASAYRGMVMVAIDGLEASQFANRPPNIEIEVAQNVEAMVCPLDPISAVVVQQSGLYIGGVASAGYDAVNTLFYVVTEGDGSTPQIEAYRVSGPDPVLATIVGLTPWRTGSGLSTFVGGLGFDPENGLLRVAAGWGVPFGTEDSGVPIEIVYNGGAIESSGAHFCNSFGWTWGNYDSGSGLKGGTGALHTVMYAINPTSGTGRLGEAGWWSGTAAIIDFRLATLRTDTYAYGWHQEAANGAGRGIEMAGIVYVPLSAEVAGGGGFNVAWSYGSWKGWIELEGFTTVITGADGTDTSDRMAHVVYAPSRQRVYIATQFDGVASMDVSAATGDPYTLDTSLAAYPAGLTFDPDFAVWNELANGLVVGHWANAGDDLMMALIDPDTMAILVGPCTYAGVARSVAAPTDLGDGRFACVWGDDSVAVIKSPGGSTTGQPVTLQSIVEDLCERSALPPANLDASAGTDLVKGFKIAAQTTARAAIDSLRPVYFFDMPEKAQQIVMVKRGANSVATIDAGELGAAMFQASGAEDSPPYELDHPEAQTIPRRLEVTYVDADANYDPGVQAAERQVGASLAPLSVEAPVVLTASEAAAVAWANLLLAHSSKTIRFKLSHHHDALIPSDPVTIPHSTGAALRVRIEQLTRIRPMLEIEGVLEIQSAYSQVVVGVPRYQLPRQVSIGTIGDTLLALLDLPPLRDADNSLLIYAAVARDTYADAWPGASVYKSLDGGASYDSQYATTSGATIGVAPGALGDWTGGNLWDDTNVLTVVLTSGTFSSATDLGVYNWANVLAVESDGDWELVQFGTATLVGANTWELSHLLRGRKGTERAMAGHASGDQVVLLAGDTIRTVAQSLGEKGALRSYKGVTSGQAVADAAAQDFTLVGRSLMPLSPVSIEGSRVGDDLTITWLRRARINAEWMDLADVPLDEATGAYSIDILGGSPLAVVRTLTSSTPTVEYTGADQTTDFGAPQAEGTVQVQIYQLSATVGRGHPGEATL